MRNVVLWGALVAWLVTTAALLWWFNPISAIDLADVCTPARIAVSKNSVSGR